MKKRIALLLAMVMVFGLLAGCGSKDPGTTAETTGSTAAAENTEETTTAAAETTGTAKYLKVQLGLNDTLSGLKPTVTAGNGYILQWIFDTLMRYDTETSEYIPALAEKLDISDDGLVYTVTLRDNYFHDGTPVTADDVVFTYTQIICGGGMRVAKLSAIEGYDAAKDGTTDVVTGIQKIDDKTVSFTLSQRNSLFIEALSNGCFAILPAAYFEGMNLEQIKENSEFWSQPIGCGAYYVSEVSYPNYIVLTRNESYYDPAGIENILCTYYADLEAAYAAMIAGEIDFLTGLEEEPANNILAQNADIEGITVDSTYHRWFMVNNSGSAGSGESHPSLQNARVRQALNLLLDKDAICQLYGELAEPSNSHINPNMPEYNSDLPVWQRDIEGAMQILDEEGFNYDIPIRIYANYTDQITADFLELVVQNLAEGGVTATYVIDGNWQEYLANTDYDLRYAANMSFNVIDFFNFAAFGGQGTAAASNYPIEDETFKAYQLARYDDLITAWKSSLDPVEQKEILDQLQYNEYEDMYNIPLYSLNIINLYNNAHVTGMPVYARDYEEVVAFHFSDWKLIY